MNSRPTPLAALAADPAAAALVMDFDGVLAPIVADPASSVLPEPVAGTLRLLAGRLGLLAVISGRPAEFLADRIRIPGLPLLGSYGMEQIRDGQLELNPAAAGWRGQVRAATGTLRDSLGGRPGIRIEEKSVSVAVHWRQAPDQEAAAAEVRELTASLASQTGLRLEPGKLVEELRPPVELDKGTAVTALLADRRPAVAAYAGDDLGDIPALTAMRAANGYTLVVDHGIETDPRLVALADQVFPGPAGFAAWLAELADLIGD